MDMAQSKPGDDVCRPVSLGPLYEVPLTKGTTTFQQRTGGPDHHHDCGWGGGAVHGTSSTIPTVPFYVQEHRPSTRGTPQSCWTGSSILWRQWNPMSMRHKMQNGGCWAQDRMRCCREAKSKFHLRAVCFFFPKAQTWN